MDFNFNNLETEVLIIQKLEDENNYEENPTVDFNWGDKLDNNDVDKHDLKTEQVV